MIANKYLYYFVDVIQDLEFDSVEDISQKQREQLNPNLLESGLELPKGKVFLGQPNFCG